MTAEKIHEHFMKLIRSRGAKTNQKETITEKENDEGEDDGGTGVPGAIIHRPGELLKWIFCENHRGEPLRHLRGYPMFPYERRFGA